MRTGLLLLVLLPQEDLGRAIDKRLEATRDAEVRGRLEKIRTRLREGARLALSGETAAPDSTVARIFETRTLVVPPADSWLTGFWYEPPSGGPITGALDAIEEVPRLLTEEALVDLIVQGAIPAAGEDGSDITRLGTGQVLVRARPADLRKVAGCLRALEAELRREIKSRIVVLALDNPYAAELDAPADEPVERLIARSRRLADFRLCGQSDQRVAAHSGGHHRFVASHDEGHPLLDSEADGVGIELHAVASPPGVKVSARVGFKKFLGTVAAPTAEGPVERPRVAEAALREEQRAPEGRWTILGRMGPLPAEAGVPPHLVVLGRFEVTR